MFDKRTLFHNASAKGVFASELHDSNDYGVIFTDKAISCRLDKCPPIIRDKFEVYAIGGSPMREMGEARDEVAMTFTFIVFSECYRLIMVKEN